MNQHKMEGSQSQEIVTTVAKVKVDTKEEIIYIISKWNSDNIEVKIICNDGHWNGRLTENEISYFFSNLCISKEEYMMSAKKALSNNIGSVEFIYRLENDKFFWEKVVNVEKNLKVIHGTINLTDAKCKGGMELLVDTLLTINQSTEDKLALKEEEAVNLSNDLMGLVDKFKNYTELKNKMEEELFEKFTTILNSKKQKIKVIEEFLKEIRTGGKTFKTMPVLRKKETALLEISDSDSG